MSDEIKRSPYSALGRKLKALRAGSGETLAEAAGAVEIEIKDLASYELGRQRPSEDVLLLLISHFDVKDEEAMKLWRSAGYHLEKEGDIQPQTLSADDNKILFTDVVDVIVNNYGVVMNFAQNGSPGSAPHNVARVGMSREHAKSVLKILQMTLAQTERPAQTAHDQTKPGPDQP